MNRRGFLIAAALALVAYHFGPRYLPDAIARPVLGPLKVLIVHEAQQAAKLTEGQQQILFGPEFEEAVKEKNGELRRIDKDAKQCPKEWELLWNRDHSNIPRLVVARGSRVTKDIPLPATLEAAIAAVK